ncbi:MAG: hypothetical protein FJ100_13030 [Deltaproteobacteria bacterium]|nr:hypothetical protein [Deltaproteobacteria bacterium]
MRPTCPVLVLSALLASPCACGGDDDLATPAGDASPAIDALATDTAASLETASWPANCTCGDKICNAACAENVTTCPSDCAACGDGTCSAGEGPSVCPVDCCGTCGDGLCKGFACGESPTTCAKDCSTACGNGKCEPGESPVTCQEDCKFKTCGNGYCEPDDGGPKGCPEDCKPGCGNCTCDKGEDWSNCPTDCGYCGDGICSTCAQNAENAASCGVDCKAAECLPNAPGACDDGVLCTTDGCTPNGVCVHALNSLPCDDGNVCTVGDACNKGACLPGPATQDCDDGNPCTADPCDVKVGCKHKAVLGQACDDGNACTKDDLCTGGFCSGGSLLDCGDGNPCTTDGCNGIKGCTTANNKAACSDGDVCTEGDGCADGGCKPGPPVACDDDNECTADSCNPKKGCAHAPNTAKCDDGDACSDSDYCFKAVCKPGVEIDCDDLNACTTDKCDPKLGCLHPNNAAPCDDANPCTLADTCAGGKCKGGKATPCADANPCTFDTCNALTGECLHLPQAATCDDADACSVTSTCKDAACVGATFKKCDDGDPCTDDTCAKPGGTCTTTQNKAACSDNNPCTAADTCDKGKCLAGPPAVCDDGNVCTTDSCDKTKGCGTAPATGVACNAGACTLGDGCQNGACVSGQKGKLFEAKFGLPGASITWVTDVAAYQDGSIGVVGYTKGSDFDAFAAKYDATGKELWKSVVPGTANDELHAAVVAPDQSLVAAGVRTPAGGLPSQLYLRFDGTGKVVSTKTHNTGNHSGAYDLRNDPGTGGFVATGYGSQETSRIALVRLGSDLAPLSQALWNNGHDNTGKGVVVGPQNTYYTAGFYTHPQTQLATGQVVQWTASGLASYNWDYGGEANDYLYAIEALSKGGFLVVGATASKGAGALDAWVLVLGKDGSMVTEHTYGGLGADGAKALAALDGGDFAIVGTSGTKGKTSDDAWLFVVDDLGKLQWDKGYGGSANDGFSGVAVSPNGSVILGGGTSTGTPAPNAWVLAVDAWGNGTCGNAGACALKPAGACDDGDPCTTDACDAKTGCAHAVVPDNSYCTAYGLVCLKGKCE